jgi:hypothetical protein
MVALLDATNIFQWLLGEWSFERDVAGHAGMTGHAAIRRLDDGTAHYREVASVRMHDGQTFRGQRRYLYRQTVDGLAVYFHPASPEEPPRLFHRLRFSPDATGLLRATAEHQCQADLYRSAYAIPAIIAPEESFTVQHDVRGPRKLLTLRTVYCRLPAEGRLDRSSPALASRDSDHQDQRQTGEQQRGQPGSGRRPEPGRGANGGQPDDDGGGKRGIVHEEAVNLV